MKTSHAMEAFAKWMLLSPSILAAIGKELYSLPTDPPNIVFLFNAAKKQLPVTTNDCSCGAARDFHRLEQRVL